MAKDRNTHAIREQTPSTIQQTPSTIAERPRVRPSEAGWTAGSDTLTSAEVAMGNNFNPLGEKPHLFPVMPQLLLIQVWLIPLLN